jgi:hypothetical protein
MNLLGKLAWQNQFILPCGRKTGIDSCGLVRAVRHR